MGHPQQIARRFGLDIKTVKRAIAQETRSVRRKSPRRPRLLDPFREELRKLVKENPTITAKRIQHILKNKIGKIRLRVAI